jgi:hypothetical protein
MVGTEQLENPSEPKKIKLQQKEYPNKTDEDITKAQEKPSERKETKLQQEESPNKTDMASTEP